MFNNIIRLDDGKSKFSFHLDHQDHSSTHWHIRLLTDPCEFAQTKQPLRKFKTSRTSWPPHNSEREKRTSTTPAVTYERARLTPTLLTSVQRYFSSPRVPTLPSQSQSPEEDASLSLYPNSPPVSLPALPTLSPSAPSPANQGPSQTAPRCTDGLCAGWEFWAWEGKDFWMFVEPWALLEPRVCCGGDLLRRENHGRCCRSSGGYPSDSEAFLSACCWWSMDGGC
jgi:hypothetical protein